MDDDRRPAYLDCAATTPIEPAVLDVVVKYLTTEFGNAGSRTHRYGTLGKEAVERAREQMASVTSADPAEVVFTSGATEANNLAILGLAEYGRSTGRTHIVTTEVEHKAVLEPAAHLAKHGFDVDFVRPDADGIVDVDAVMDAVRPDTLLVSVMHVNNETGMIQPVEGIAEQLIDHEAYLHVDAAQSFGKLIEPLRNKRVDLISASGHKLFAPKGVGALIARRRRHRRPPLQPLFVGGGQERGLRPGTQPVHLIAGFGTAAELALRDADRRAATNRAMRERILEALAPLNPMINGNPDQSVPHILNVAIPGVDTEAAILALRDLVAISNGSACTSASYEPSHVLRAMGTSDDVLHSALRLSWSHLTDPALDLSAVTDALRSLT